MEEYQNTSNLTIVVVVDGALKVIEPKEKFMARNIVHIPQLVKLTKEIEPPKKKRKTNARKTDN